MLTSRRRLARRIATELAAKVLFLFMSVTGIHGRSALRR